MLGYRFIDVGRALQRHGSHRLAYDAEGADDRRRRAWEGTGRCYTDLPPGDVSRSRRLSCPAVAEAAAQKAPS